jgi:uncharacterized protein (TIGR02147 family)
MPDIFSYIDYRLYIKDFCNEIHESKPFFSYRYIGQKAGVKSTGLISWVVMGKRNLSAHLIHKLSKIMRLSGKEAAFFEVLVNYNQSKQTEEKQFYLEKMLSIKKVRADVVEQDRAAFYSEWYYSAIRELIAIHQVKDEEQIAAIMRPTIKKYEARDALDLLVRLGLIKKNAKGFYERGSAVLTSSPAIDAAVIHNFQFVTMQLAQSSLHRFKREERDVSTVTLSCDQEAIGRIREKIAEMRSEVLKIACACKNPDQVFQLNTQIFPLSSQIKSVDHE